MSRNSFKFTAIAFLLLFMGAVFFMKPANVNAGLVGNGPKFLGNVIARSAPANFATYWNQVTPENSCQWPVVESSRDMMNWSGADAAYNYARSNGFPFKFYTLIWGSSYQGWLTALSPDDLKAEIIEWFQAAGMRFKDTKFVDVVNEPLHIPPAFRFGIGGEGSTGWDWVIWSFEQARIAFPNSKLLLNEYGIMNDPAMASRYVTLINLLKSRGLIDGIGIECHYSEMDTTPPTDIRSALDRLAETGLPIYVSELDMGGDDSTQLARYREKFPVLWEHPAVAGVTIWGYIQGQTWQPDTWLISSSGVERPAMQWLRQYFLFTGSPTPTSRPTSTQAPSLTPTPTQRRITLTPTRRRTTPTVTRRIMTPTSTPTSRQTPTPTLSVTLIPTPVRSPVTVIYVIQSDWGNGHTANFTIRNNTATVIPAGWTLSWDFVDNQIITSLWNGTYTQSGRSVSVKGIFPIPANGGTVDFGFNGSGPGGRITNVRFNGVPVDGGIQ